MKNLFALILGCVISVLVATLFMPTAKYSEEDIPVMKEITVKAFQLGAYQAMDAAQAMAEKHHGIVVSSNGYYTVYASILSNEANVAKMMAYLEKDNIYYYVKSISTSEEFNTELQKYEEMMMSTTSDIAFQELNKRILDLYEATYED